MRTTDLRLPPTPLMTISRDINGSRYYIARRPDGSLGGTFDRAEALEFRNFQEFALGSSDSIRPGAGLSSSPESIGSMPRLIERLLPAAAQFDRLRSCQPDGSGSIVSRLAGLGGSASWGARGCRRLIPGIVDQASRPGGSSTDTWQAGPWRRGVRGEETPGQMRLRTYT